MAKSLKDNVRFQQLHKYERGTNRLCTAKIRQFAKALNLPPSYCFADARRYVAEGETVAEVRLILLFRSLRAHKQYALIQLLGQS